MLPLPTLAQSLLEAGKTDVGVLYIDSESVNTVKKDGKLLPCLLCRRKIHRPELSCQLKAGRRHAECSISSNAVFI